MLDIYRYIWDRQIDEDWEQEFSLMQYSQNWKNISEKAIERNI